MIHIMSDGGVSVQNNALVFSMTDWIHLEFGVVTARCTNSADIGVVNSQCLG